MRPDDIAAQVVSALVERTKVNPDDIEDLILGCAFPEGEQGLNVARLIVLLAGLPQSVAGVTVNRFCGSSMQSVHMAAGQIQLGAGEVFICAGVESMSRVPMSGFNPLLNPALQAKVPAAYIGMGDTAENVARKYSISRAEQEAFAVRSQQRAAAAAKAGPLHRGTRVHQKQGTHRGGGRMPAPGHDGRGTRAAETCVRTLRAASRPARLRR